MGRFIEPKTVFIGKPILVEESGDASRPWRLMRDVVYETNDGELIVAPEAMLTDFASIPRWVWWLWPPYDPTYGKAAVIHDWLYQMAGQIPGRTYLRREANLIFMEAMESLGAGYFRRSTLFNAVELFGPRW